MLALKTLAGENEPPSLPAPAACIARNLRAARKRPVPDTWVRLRGGIGSAIAIGSGLGEGYLTAIPRRLGDRLFAAGDTEAYWRGWQIIKLHAGLARRYRDPGFPPGTAHECDSHAVTGAWMPHSSGSVRRDATG